jgi:hypothetical protein
MQLCRGPLPEGQPREGVQYFCPDLDVPLAASGLCRVPVIQPYQYTESEAVLLEAHRAPDDWFAAACRMPNLLIQGDPDARRPAACNLFAGELGKEPARPRAVHPHAGYTPTLSAALPLARGRTVVLCGSYEISDAVYAHLRPDGPVAGDGAMDRYGRYTQVHALMHGPYVSVDGGQRQAKDLVQHVAISPSMVRSGEYDTVIVMPDVPEPFARAICRRTRYFVIGVGHSPIGYLIY